MRAHRGVDVSFKHSILPSKINWPVLAPLLMRFTPYFLQEHCYTFKPSNLSIPVRSSPRTETSLFILLLKQWSVFVPSTETSPGFRALPAIPRLTGQWKYLGVWHVLRTCYWFLFTLILIPKTCLYRERQSKIDTENYPRLSAATAKSLPGYRASWKPAL